MLFRAEAFPVGTNVLQCCFVREFSPKVLTMLQCFGERRMSRLYKAMVGVVDGV